MSAAPIGSLSASVVGDGGLMAGKPDACSAAVLAELCRCLSGDFDTEHSTFQLETADRRRLETISGAVLIWRLSAEVRGNLDEEAVEHAEHRAERLVGVAFLVLAAYVGYEAIRSLLNNEEPAASPVGIALTALSIVVMLWLARAKRQTGIELGSRALVADAQQTYACWYLSVVTLAGLALNALFGWWWADPIAALGIVVLLIREGKEALQGQDDHD